MSSPFLKLIQTGATAEVADAVQADPALVNSRDPQGVSMLLWAVYFNQSLVRDFLLARLAADGIALDIFEAAATGNEAQLAALLDAQPELAQSFSGDGWTPLHLAAAFGTPAAVSALLAAGAQVDAVHVFCRHRQSPRPGRNPPRPWRRSTPEKRPGQDRSRIRARTRPRRIGRLA